MGGDGRQVGGDVRQVGSDGRQVGGDGRQVGGDWRARPRQRGGVSCGMPVLVMTSGTIIAAMWNATAPLVAASTALYCRLPRAESRVGTRWEV